MQLIFFYLPTLIVDSSIAGTAISLRKMNFGLGKPHQIMSNSQKGRKIDTAFFSKRKQLHSCVEANLSMNLSVATHYTQLIVDFFLHILL